MAAPEVTGTRPEATAGPAVPGVAKKRGPAGRRKVPWLTPVFLAPALVILGAIVVYPTFFSVYRSLFDRAGSTFVGADNYVDIFTSSRTLTAVKNNALWVAIVPAVVTSLGLIFAVLLERIRWSTAFKVAVFMPMAISFLATGVIWRLVYQQEPERGVANAGIRVVTDVFRPPGNYPGAKPSQPDVVRPAGKTLMTGPTVRPGDTVRLGLIAIPTDLVPKEAVQARDPDPVPSGISGVVWRDFSPGGGKPGVVEPLELGLAGAKVEAVSADGAVAGSAVAAPDGTFRIEGLQGGPFRLRLAESNFRPPFGGIQWLGPTLVTPAIMFSYVWIWAGFAMVVIGAGLAAIPREVLEAARVDGAGEWQLFRRVTVPLLAPVLGVVFITLAINVLKVFDLVLVIAPGSVQANANVIALEIFRNAFSGGFGNKGVASALAVFLFILVIPVMLLNIRRFRSES